MEKYIFCIIALLIQPLFIYVVYFRKQKKSDAALKMPLLYFSGAYLVVQGYVFYKYCLKLKGDLEIYSYLIQVGILIVFIILELFLIMHNSHIKRIDKQEAECVADFKALMEQLEIKKIMFDDVKKQKELNKVLEIMRYQDPVSSKEVLEINRQIEVLISGITEEMEIDKVSSVCNRIVKLLEIRKIKNTKERG